MKSRIDWAGAVLAVVALVVCALSFAGRRDSSRWYAETAATSRAMTAFVVEQRTHLRDRPVALFGLSGLSPWSQSDGAYLARLLGTPIEWHVFVLRETPFYAFATSARPGGVSVHPESQACSLLRNRDPVYVVFDANGKGRLASDCTSALDPVDAPPTIEAWGPKSVTAAEAEAGFNMYFTGTALGGSVDVSVAGKPLPMTRAQQGRLMTTAIPPRSTTDGDVVRFSVDYRGKSVLAGQVTVRPNR